MKNFWTVSGRSGSGKDTLVDILLEMHPEWKKVVSKTTRPRRSPKEDCHIFTTEKEYMNDVAKGIVIAHTFYNGYHYWATVEQVEAADLYIIDIPGLKELKLKYNGPKQIKSIGLFVSPQVSAERMTARGDSDVSINRRLIIDNEEFKPLGNSVDVLLNVDTMTPKEVAKFADAVIRTYEFLHY